MCMQEFAETIHTRFKNAEGTARIHMARETATDTTDGEIRLEQSVVDGTDETVVGGVTYLLQP